MKKVLLICLLLSTLSFGQYVPSPQDAANHSLVGAGLAKVLNAYFDEETTFALCTLVFVGKELTDKTGFSIQDLVYDYMGYGLVMVEIKF